jgi:quercetin dioxygenase-like cupin family protein
VKIALSVLAYVFFAHAADMRVVLKSSDNKFEPVPGLPQCITGAVQSGDPATGPSVISFKATPGCVVPWHWHTPTEHIMLVSGSARVEMKDGAAKPAVLGPGGYAMLPAKHVHQFTCPTACAGFVYSDAAFDIHYVDESGAEIPPETALSKKK